MSARAAHEVRTSVRRARRIVVKVGSGVLTREIDNKTVLTVISKPVSRPLFIVGKFLGLAAGLAVAFFMSAVLFFLSVRHSVMSTASDKYDMPVLLFGSPTICITKPRTGWDLKSAALWPSLMSWRRPAMRRNRRAVPGLRATTRWR